MENLTRYNFMQRVTDDEYISALVKSDKGQFIKVKDLISYLRTFDSDEEIITTMEYIISTQFKD